MTSPGAEIQLGGNPYNLVMDNSGESYKVTDVPAHPDSDSRMERKVIFNSLVKGILPRREQVATDGTAYVTGNPWNRVSKAAEGFWWANGLYTGLGDRILPQRNTYSTQAIASAPVRIGDSSVGSYIACAQHLYFITGVVGGVQQVTLSLGGGTVTTFTGTQIVDVVSYAGKLYVASCATTNGVADYTQPQPMWVYDGSTWVNDPQPLAAVTGIAISNTGTAGTTRYDYTVVAYSSNKNGNVSQSITTTTGNATLTGSNYNTITWNSVVGATTYYIYRTYAGGNPKTLGPIGSTASLTFNDTGLAPIATPTVYTPGYVAADTRKATSFVVIRNNIYRGTGATIYEWDNSAATWDSGTVVGDPALPITALDLFRESLIVFKQEGVFSVTTGGQVINLFPGFKTFGINPRPLAQWRGNYYLAMDNGGIWEWNGRDVRRIGFSESEPYPIRETFNSNSSLGYTLGIPNAVTRGVSLPNYMVVGFNRVGAASNDAAFFLAFNDQGWHPYRYMNNYQSSAIGITGGLSVPANPVLQFGLTRPNLGAPYNVVQYMNNPLSDPFIANDFDVTTQELFYAVDNGIIDDEYKVLESFSLLIENSTAGTVLISYATDDNIGTLTFTDMVAVPQSNQTMTTIFVPPGDASTFPAYKKILFRLRVTPNASTIAPIVRTGILRYKQREPQRQCWDLLLYIEQGQRTSLGNVDSRPSSTQVTALKTLRRNQNLVQFVDIFGDPYWVYVESVGEKLHTFKNNVFGSWVCAVKLVETAAIIGVS